MSRRRTAMLGAFALLSAPGCWEQMSVEWWPQMKRQAAIGAYEEVLHRDQIEAFSPPEGVVPVGGSARPDLASMSFPEQDAVPNPVPASLESLKNGQELWGRYCRTCHGANGAGDGPVAAAGPLNPGATGPLQGVLPLTGQVGKALTGNLSDGHIYATISRGRGRMPNYARIPADERWDIVNYVRELNDPGGLR